MAIDTVQKMESMKDEFENQIITDGNIVWVEAYNAIEKAIAYQTKKQNDAMARAYTRHDNS